MRFDTYSYAPLAFIYDELASFYSLGRIAQSKRAQLSAIEPGARVLYAGVGRGEDAILAARFGAQVTFDISTEQLDNTPPDQLLSKIA